MAIIGDVFGLTSIYERQVENIGNNNFESWPESATYGYFGGGYSGSAYVDTVERIDFSNETLSFPLPVKTSRPLMGSSRASV